MPKPSRKPDLASSAGVAVALEAAGYLADEGLATAVQLATSLQKPLLLEWLDAVGLEHEDGVLKTGAPSPPDSGVLRKAFEAFSGGDNPERRKLLLEAFAAQSAIDWPELEALIGAEA